MLMTSPTKKHALALLSVVLCVAACLSAGRAAEIPATHPSLRAADLPRLISAREFYSNKYLSWGHQISPDGKRLAWLESRDGNLSFRLRPLDERHIVIMTHLKFMPKFDWTLDSRHVLFRPFAGRNRHLFLADTDAFRKAPRDLTPFEGVNVRTYFLLLGKPDSVMVVMNLRDRHAYDLYEINMRTGDYELRAKSDGPATEWITDRNGRPVARLQKAEDGAWSVQAAEHAGSWRTILSGTFRDTVALMPYVPNDSTTIYVHTDAGRDKQSLIRLDLATGREDVVFEAPDTDILNLWFDVQAYKALLVFYLNPLPRYHFFDLELQRDLESLMGTAPIFYHMSSASLDHTRLVLQAHTDRQGISTYLVDRPAGTRELLAAPAAAKFAEDLSETLPVRFRARDGLPLSGYLTLPKGTDKTRLPMVLKVHGGPWFQDRWGFDPETQYLANRGYAVLEVNFRGSTGFGKAFMEKARREFGRKMQEDLIDAVDWAIAQGYADPERVAVYGDSYGGYAALMAMAQTRGKFAAGISVMGITDLTLLVDDFRSNPAKLAWWLHFAGDTHDEAVYRELKRYSPVTHASEIQRPLLLFHGAKDTRVSKKHFERFMVELRKGDAPVDYLIFPDEGHGIRKTANRLKFAQRIERFLAQHLGGRAGPLD